MDPKQTLERQQNHEKMKAEERICRLCFKRCGNFETIDGDIKEVLNVLLPRIDLAAIRKPVMCTLCEEIVFTSFDFKATCLNTHDYLFPFINKKDDVKLNLKDIYMIKNKNSESVPEDENICGFCISPVKSCSAIVLDIGERDFMLEETLEQCLPELDLSVIKEPVICVTCHTSIEKHFRFVTCVLIVEEKIRKYRETLKISSKSQMDLGRTFQFFLSEVDDSKLDTMPCDDSEGVVEVEHKYNTSMDIDDTTFNNDQNLTPKNMLDCDIENNETGTTKVNEVYCGLKGIELTKENLLEMKDQKLLLHEEIEIKTDDPNSDRCEEGFVVAQQTGIAGLNEQRSYSVLPSFDGNLLKRHDEQTFTKKGVTKGALTHHMKHRDISKETVYKCDSCEYQTKYKRVLAKHLMKHSDISQITYKCESCLYETKYKSLLKIHLLKHKNPADVTMHKCNLSLYETKYEPELKRQSQRHKSPSDVTMYKCDLCLYEAKYMSHLERHFLTHKSPSEVTMYKCNSCLYDTKYKSKLKRHVLRHKSSSEGTMYKCDSCAYQTKYKLALKSHLLKHKDISEVTMYKCGSCAYQTKYKHVLERHLLKHSDISQITTYKCDLCLYEAKHMSHLKRHFLTHKSSSEVTMYKCNSCLYVTKYKSKLKEHFLIHKSPSEVTMYKCDSCIYETKYKVSLKSHLLKHKDITEVTMYKCDSCVFQTKYKRALKQHLLKHKDNTEVIMYKCDSCVFQTKYKRALKSHLLKHEDISEVSM